MKASDGTQYPCALVALTHLNNNCQNLFSMIFCYSYQQYQGFYPMSYLIGKYQTLASASVTSGEKNTDNGTFNYTNHSFFMQSSAVPHAVNSILLTRQTCSCDIQFK